MLKTAIYCREINRSNEETLRYLWKLFKEQKAECSFFHKLGEEKILKLTGEKTETFKGYEQLIEQGIEYLISVGGDGTFLDTAQLVRDSRIPVLGINTGRLGFLSSVSREEINLAVESMVERNFVIDKRQVLQLDSSEQLFGDLNFGLNEFTIHKTDTSSMITIHTYLNGELLNSYWADGLIVATPTGSTAYSLSCGGPVIYPSSENFVITPVAPHNLTIRPIVVPNDMVISFDVESRGGKFLCTLDSRFKTAKTSVQLAVRKANFSIHILRFQDSNFLNTIRHKLMWGADQRN